MDYKGCNMKIIVTGASSGIGRAISEKFLSDGATVVMHCNTNVCPFLEARDRAGTEGWKEPVLITADLTSYDGVIEFISSAIDAIGGVDVVINNAGDIVGAKSFLDLDYESWHKTLELDLMAPFFISREAFKYMKEHGGGKIINISSIAAKYGGSETTMHYGAAKAGLESLTKAMAKAGAPYKILVNTVRLGVIDTDLHKRLGRNIDEKAKRVPLKRVGRPEEVAELVAFIASKHGDYMTGQVYSLTGGD
jgi:3-oxoacyl-[acyl-carrier protein] reductase